MYICGICGCRCDAGELHGGVCDDCREEAALKEQKREEWRQMRARHITEQADGQLVLIC